jgi:Zn-dependent oligopeptidase
MHVALSKTDFQMINGARVPLDFAEVPSHFTEQFIYDYSFVKQWATDHENKPIDEELFNKIVIKERVVEMISLQELIYFSLLDLHFHKLKKEELSLDRLASINSQLVIIVAYFRYQKPPLQEP